MSYPDVTAARVIHWLETPESLFRGDLMHDLLEEFDFTLEQIGLFKELHSSGGRDALYDYFDTPYE